MLNLCAPRLVEDFDSYTTFVVPLSLIIQPSKLFDINCIWRINKDGKSRKECSTAQNMKFSVKDFLRKCDQIRSLQRIWSHLLKKSLMENFIFCAVRLTPASLV